MAAEADQTVEILVDGEPISGSNPLPTDGSGGGSSSVRARVQANSAGLTTATTAYSAGDQLGSILTFAGAAQTAGGHGVIQSIVLVDRAKVVGAVNLYIYRSTVGLAADNAAFSVSDADQDSLVGVVQLPAPVVGGANSVSAAYGLGIEYDCAATSLFVAMHAVSGHSFFGAVSDLRLTLFTEQF